MAFPLAHYNSVCFCVLNAMAVQIPKGNSTDEVDTGKSPITFTVQLNEHPPNKQHDVHLQQQVQMKPQMEGQLQTPPQLSENHNNEIYPKEEDDGGETEMPQQEKQQYTQSFSTEFIFKSGMSLGANNNHTFQSLSIIDGGLMADASQSLLSQMTSFDNDDFTYPLTKDAMPIFDFGMPRNITARTGHTEAVIRCRVSWIRKRDLHILTVGTATYTSDKRFQVTESKDSREWTLHVKSPQARDSGIYECQVNTEPKISMAFQLNVIEISPDAKAVITGPADLHFKVGSAIILTCIVYQPSVKDIGPIYWYRGEYMITPFDINDSENEIAQPTLPSTISRTIEDNVKPGTPSHAAHKTDALEGYSEGEQMPNEITQDFTQRIAMESQLGDTMKSRLRISNAQASDTGNYTCQPTTASSASVMVHVINDENPAAMQKSRGEGLKSMTMTTAIVIGLANVSSKLLVLMLTTAFSFNTLLKFLCHEN
uniref:Ig-like domain-containing protein n=1 Tax=Glossina pallidipes TaxID=7398 RepID=A0A1B0A3Y8_GLOPL